MLNKKTSTYIPVDRTTKNIVLIIMAMMTSIGIAFCMASYPVTRSFWMVTAICLSSRWLYRAVANGRIKITNATPYHNSYDSIHGRSDPSWQPGMEMQDERLSMPAAGLVFSHAQAVASNNGIDDGGSVIYGYNSSGAITPYGT